MKPGNGRSGNSFGVDYCDDPEVQSGRNIEKYEDAMDPSDFGNRAAQEKTINALLTDCHELQTEACNAMICGTVRHGSEWVGDW